ncbi:deoxycytidylate deaminase-related [Holotrichia oblita]|nr:deoxycytidylate deaminase-related [Holotrichia oblita]
MVISWDEYFMGVALLSAKRSKDPNTQVGACIVNPNKVIVGVGYNGTPRGWDDKDFPWDKRDGEFTEQKYPYIIHAELNAILNANTKDLSGCTMYATLSPCNECAKAIVQSGIKRVVYISDKYKDVDIFKAAKKMFATMNIPCEQLKTDLTDLTINYKF